MTKINTLLLFVALSLCSLSLTAQNVAIGFVKTVEGDASVVDSGKAVKAQPGFPLQLGSVLKTGEDGSLGVTFKDNTVISIGPETEIAIDEFLYAPAKGNLKLVASLAQGTMHYISGVIAKLKPESVSVKTPTGIIGVRGTRFVARAEAK